MYEKFTINIRDQRNTTGGRAIVLHGTDTISVSSNRIDCYK